LNELALFAGAGGGILGGKLLGWRTVCAVEINDYARRVLLARQDDGCLSPFPIWDDITTFDGRAWRGIVDVVSGGFPCQDISSAGKGAGIDGERSGLWRKMARIICEVGPRFVLVENSPMLTSRGLGRVLGDLAAMGYDARWGVLGAVDAGAPHKRERIWIVANTDRLHEQRIVAGVTDKENRSKQEERPAGSRGNVCEWWATEPDVGRVAHGVAARVDRLRCLGNGQVPAVVRLAWRILSPITTQPKK
jgi:DNA (cytosine-5)-methyltransferase 1